MAKLEDYKPMDEGDILKALELNINQLWVIMIPN